MHVCRLPAEDPVYELIDIPSRSDPLENSPHTVLTASKQKQPRASNSPHLTPVTTTNQQVFKCDQQTDVCTAKDEENTYQPLIPPRATANSDPNEYQSLTQHTLPKKFNLPPAIPLKPDAKNNT